MNLSRFLNLKCFEKLSLQCYVVSEIRLRPRSQVVLDHRWSYFDCSIVVKIRLVPVVCDKYISKHSPYIHACNRKVEMLDIYKSDISLMFAKRSLQGSLDFRHPYGKIASILKW